MKDVYLFIIEIHKDCDTSWDKASNVFDAYTKRLLVKAELAVMDWRFDVVNNNQARLIYEFPDRHHAQEMIVICVERSHHEDWVEHELKQTYPTLRNEIKAGWKSDLGQQEGK